MVWPKLPSTKYFLSAIHCTDCSTIASLFRPFVLSLPENHCQIAKLALNRCYSTISIGSKSTLTVIMDANGDNPKQLRLNSPLFRALFTDELNCLAKLFKKYNYEIRIAGGAVRDLLMDIKPNDVDFATTATPDQMRQMFQVEKIRVLHKAGEKHGTVACRINDTENFEVTTLRIDLECDGRRAEVEFTTNWQLDAARRDLTVNSLFLDLDGCVHDYFGGVDDILNRKIRFVGNAEERITEDYLRILRYFRFYGRLATEPNEHEQTTLDAIRNNAAGLNDISGERLWVELKKIVIGRYADAVVHTMLDVCQLGQYLGIPINADTQLFVQLFNDIQALQPESMTMLCALFNNIEHLNAFHQRMRLSNFDRLLAVFIIKERENVHLWCDKSIDEQTKYFKWIRLDLAFQRQPNADIYISELLKYHNKAELVNALKCWDPPSFPVNGRDLMPYQDVVPKGPPVGITLKYLYELWKESDGRMDQHELLEHVNDDKLQQAILATLSPKQKRRRIRKDSQ